MSLRMMLKIEGLTDSAPLWRSLIAARRAMLTNLAVQAETAATERSRGPNSAAAGSYPIPVRTGAFLRGFGLEIHDTYSLVYNDREYARKLHEGFYPYDNKQAHPIPARPYFDDAIKAIDQDAAEEAWWKGFDA